MKISTKGRYALRLMADIGAHDQSGCVSLRDVAARQEISVKYLEQIAGMLTKAGFLYSERGAQGGYRLSRAPEEYTVGSILRLTEGDLGAGGVSGGTGKPLPPVWGMYHAGFLDGAVRCGTDVSGQPYSSRFNGRRAFPRAIETLMCGSCHGWLPHVFALSKRCDVPERKFMF